MMMTIMCLKRASLTDTSIDLSKSVVCVCINLLYQLNAKDDVDTDALPDSEIQASTKKITLTGGFGQMHERKKPSVFRFRKYNKDTDASDWYRAKLMLYHPWYDESTDLLGGFSRYVTM